VALTLSLFPLQGPGGLLDPPPWGPPPRIDKTSYPSWVGGPPSFAQATSFLGRASSHTLVDGLVRLAKAFPELPTERLQAMQTQQHPSQPGQKKAKVTVHGPSHQKVLLTSNPPPREGMLSLDFLLSSIGAVLLAHHSTLVAEAVAPAYGRFTVSCDCVATQEELFAICDGATPVSPASAKVMVILPTSMSYLKLTDVPYLSHSGQTITPEEVMDYIQRLPAASSMILMAPICIVHNSVASDMATVYLNIADTVSGVRAKEVVNHPLQMGGRVSYI